MDILMHFVAWFTVLAGLVRYTERKMRVILVVLYLIGSFIAYSGGL